MSSEYRFISRRSSMISSSYIGVDVGFGAPAASRQDAEIDLLKNGSTTPFAIAPCLSRHDVPYYFATPPALTCFDATLPICAYFAMLFRCYQFLGN